MERIFLSRLLGLLIVCFSCSMCFGQQHYYVFKKRGTPTVAKTKGLERGSLFTETDTLMMKATDYVLFVNELGELFEIAQPNTYVFSAIVDYRRKLKADSFTKKYFAYVWKQFTNQNKKMQEAGVVYREERNVKLLAPRDSVKFFAPEIVFSWHNTTDEEGVYFFLRDLKTGHLTKIGISGSSIILNLDNVLLKAGQTYEWSVATTSFPNLNELKFNYLNMVTKPEYEKLEKQMAALLKAFTLLGFTESEIKEVICQDYKFCTS